jgi:FkbM family methyltransferase
VKTAKHADLIYDVGLHKGEDAEFYLNKGFRVIAFEAEPELAALARKRLSKYVENGRLTIVEGAIVDDPVLHSGKKTITFYKSSCSVCGTLHQRWVDRNAIGGASVSAIEVDVIDFAQCVQRYGVPYYMKIDIEGSDIYCLRALRKFDLRPDFVSIETEHASVAGLEEEMNLLDQLRYDRFQLVQQDGIQRVKPPFPAKEGLYVPFTFPDGSSGLFGRELPGRWLTKAETLQKGRRFIFGFNFWGGRGLQRNWLGQRIHGVLKRLARRPLVGWYDTHARHSSVTE